jgi:hypothetical protein
MCPGAPPPPCQRCAQPSPGHKLCAACRARFRAYRALRARGAPVPPGFLTLYPSKRKEQEEGEAPAYQTLDHLVAALQAGLSDFCAARARWAACCALRDAGTADGLEAATSLAEHPGGVLVEKPGPLDTGAAPDDAVAQGGTGTPTSAAHAGGPLADSPADSTLRVQDALDVAVSSAPDAAHTPATPGDDDTRPQPTTPALDTGDDEKPPAVNVRAPVGTSAPDARAPVAFVFAGECSVVLGPPPFGPYHGPRADAVVRALGDALGLTLLDVPVPAEEVRKGEVLRRVHGVHELGVPVGREVGVQRVRVLVDVRVARARSHRRMPGQRTVVRVQMVG